MTEKKDWHTATLGYKATIRDAIKKLSASSLQIILVVEENNLLLGTITDGDIRRAILRGSTLDGNLKDLMNNDPLVVSPDITFIIARIELSKDSLAKSPILSADIS